MRGVQPFHIPMDRPPFEQFAPLKTIPAIEHLFITRARDVAVTGDKLEMRRRLAHFHARCHAAVGRAKIGSPSRKRCRSSASSSALW